METTAVETIALDACSRLLTTSSGPLLPLPPSAHSLVLISPQVPTHKVFVTSVSECVCVLN